MNEPTTLRKFALEPNEAYSCSQDRAARCMFSTVFQGFRRHLHRRLDKRYGDNSGKHQAQQRAIKPRTTLWPGSLGTDSRLGTCSSTFIPAKCILTLLRVVRVPASLSRGVSEALAAKGCTSAMVEPRARAKLVHAREPRHRRWTQQRFQDACALTM